MDTGLVEVLQVVQGIQHATGRRDGVDPFSLEEGPERFQVLQQSPEHTNRQCQEST
jgi:hypothetical protein